MWTFLIPPPINLVLNNKKTDLCNRLISRGRRNRIVCYAARNRNRGNSSTVAVLFCPACTVRSFVAEVSGYSSELELCVCGLTSAPWAQVVTEARRSTVCDGFSPCTVRSFVAEVRGYSSELELCVCGLTSAPWVQVVTEARRSTVCDGFSPFKTIRGHGCFSHKPQLRDRSECSMG